MKKVFKMMFVLVTMFAVCLALTSCGSVSESYANKVNEAAKEEAFTKEQVYKDLGDPGFEAVVGGTGYATWYKGYKTFEEAMEAFDNGKTVKTIRVVFVLGKATAASYSEGKPSNDKN